MAAYVQSRNQDSRGLMSAEINLNQLEKDIN
jgi:hypothetical protein